MPSDDQPIADAPEVDATASHNAQAWDALVRRDAKLTQPAGDEEFANPLRTVDPLGWLGGSIAGWRVLCLAAGGGRQSALYAAAGASVTVLDLSREMLARDRRVAAERRLDIQVIEGSMDNLSMLPQGGFDAVIQPVSTCYVPDVQAVYRQVAHVTRPGGLYVSQHKAPTSLQASHEPTDGRYTLDEPYYRDGPLPPADATSRTAGRLREPGTVEFLHRWEQLLGGLCRAGFAIEDLIEPVHADPDAPPGAFGHRARFVAPYVRVKARRPGGGEPPATILLG